MNIYKMACSPSSMNDAPHVAQSKRFDMQMHPNPITPFHAPPRRPDPAHPFHGPASSSLRTCRRPLLRLRLLHLLYIIFRLHQPNLSLPSANILLTSRTHQLHRIHPFPSLTSPTARPPSSLPSFIPTSRAPSPSAPPPHKNTKKRTHTILNSLHIGSLGCAPTPSQYFARDVSSLISLIGFPSLCGAAFGTGSYVPRTSSGFELRAVLRVCSVWLRRGQGGGLYRAWATTIL